MIEYCSVCGGTVADGEHVGECELPVCDQCGEPFFRSEGRFWVNDLICHDCWRESVKVRFAWRFLVHHEMAEELRLAGAWLDRMVSIYGKGFWYYI